MYLAYINEQARELFLDLAIYAAMADANMEMEEKVLLDGYCYEMGLPIPEEYKASKSLDEILDQLNTGCSGREKNMITMEILSVVLADDDYDDSERKLMDKIQSVLQVPKEKIQNMIDVINELKTIYAKMNDMMGE